jgi:hypothetical protein
MLAASGYRINHSLNIIVESVLLGQGLCILQQGPVLAVELLVRLDYLPLLLLTETGPHQAPLINAPSHRRIMTADNHKWHNIVINPGKARCEAPFANCNKLMQSHHPAKPGAGFNLAMPAYVHTITHNNLIFDRAIMSDVRSNHKQIIVSYFRKTSLIKTPMDCHLLTKGVVITYHKTAYLGIRTQTQFLRPAANHTIGRKVIVLADIDIFANHYISIKHCTGTD